MPFIKLVNFRKGAPRSHVWSYDHCSPTAVVRLCELFRKKTPFDLAQGDFCDLDFGVWLAVAFFLVLAGF